MSTQVPVASNYIPTAPPPGTDETLSAVIEHSQRSGEQDFTCKVNRAPNAGARFTHIATFEDVTPKFLPTAERWLSLVFGGGDYQLAIYSKAGIGNARIGGFLRYTINPTKIPPLENINRAAFRDSNYEGPSVLSFPAPSQMSPEDTGGMLHSSPKLGLQMLTPAPTAFDANLFAAQRALDEEKQRLQARQHQLELENVTAKTEIKTQEAIARAKQEIGSKQQPIGEVIAGIIAAATPFISMWQQANAQREERERSEQHRREERDRADREARDRREAEERAIAREEMRLARESAAARDKILFDMMAKNAEPKTDPLINTVLEMNRNHTNQLADMSVKNIEMMGAYAKMSTGMIETIAELRLGDQPESNPIVDAVKETVRAIASMSSSHVKQAEKAAKTPMPQVPQLQQKNPTPAPAPNMPPAQAFNDAQKQPTVMQQLEQMVKSHIDVNVVAKVVLEAAQSQEPSFVKAIQSADGDVERMVIDMLGPWVVVPENKAYLEGLATAIERLAGEASEDSN